MTDDDADDTDTPGGFDDCTTSAELVEMLEREAQNGDCAAVKRAKNALSRGESVGALPPEAVGSALLTVVDSGDDHALRLECAQGLATVADANPTVLVDFIWDIQDVILESYDPSLVEHLITAATKLAITGPSATARGVAETLMKVCRSNETDDYVYCERDQKVAIEGLRTLATRGGPTVQVHLAQVLVSYIESELTG
jgi:hypothetical protein